jgi:hypothetical protein
MLRFEELAEPERAIWNAVEAGSLVELPFSAPTAKDPATGQSWGEDRQVRAQLLYELLVGINRPNDVRPRALNLAGARITGTLNLEATTLVCPLSLHRCYFDQPINLREAQAPAVRLPGCRVPGLDGAQLQTRGNLELNEGIVVTGKVTLVGANIGGSLRLWSAALTNPGGEALTAHGLMVGQNMICHEVNVHGEVNLMGAHVGGQLGFNGATLVNPAGDALRADGLGVGQAMFFHGFCAEGVVRLAGAHIGSNLEFDGARLINPGRRALAADGLTVGSDMFCRRGFRADGEIRLLGADIGGQLDFEGATLTNPGGVALDLERVRTRSLILRLKVPPEGTVDLTRAQVDTCDDSQAAWPGDLRLRGFMYGRLNSLPEVDATTRLRWLERDPGGYFPEVYEQLAAAYRNAGQDDDTRAVAIAKQRRRRQTLNWRGKAWNTLLHWTVGYGYETWKAGAWLLVLVGLGWGIFDIAHPAHLVAAKPPGQRPGFNAGLYTLDVLLPFADLGYQGAWIAMGWARWPYLGWNLAGWVLITAVVAALSGLIKRD